MISRRRLPLVAVVMLTLISAACASQEKFLDSRQAQAVQTAVSRAQFDMNCPNAAGQVLSREVTQPPFQGPVAVGEQRGLFTVGVEGCGQRQTYQVLCPMGGDGCFAAEGGGRLLR